MYFLCVLVRLRVFVCLRELSAFVFVSVVECVHVFRACWCLCTWVFACVLVCACVWLCVFVCVCVHVCV